MLAVDIGLRRYDKNWKGVRFRVAGVKLQGLQPRFG